MDDTQNQQSQIVYVQQPANQIPKASRIKGLIFSGVSLELGICAVIFAVVAFIMTLAFSLSFAYSTEAGVPLVLAFYFLLLIAALSVPSLIFGTLAKKIAHFGMASAGVILSIISLVLVGLSFIVSFGFFIFTA